MTKASDFDIVAKPSHYADKEIEVIDYSRWRKKGGIDDLEKAKVYLGWAIKGASADGE